MIDYYAAFILGLVGSVHCAGMCGPLAMALPGGGSGLSFSSGRMAYNLGRVATYCALGLVFGALGTSLTLAGFQGGISIALGALLLAGLLLSRKLVLWRPLTSLVSHLKACMSAALQKRSFLSLVLLGLLNGLLPCGLVYAACVGAAATGDLAAGAAYMAAFGAGTIPMMLTIGLSGRIIPPALRLKLIKAVPVTVVLLASLLILRGLGLGIPYVSPPLDGSSCCHRQTR